MFDLRGKVLIEAAFAGRKKKQKKKQLLQVSFVSRCKIKKRWVAIACKIPPKSHRLIEEKCGMAEEGQLKISN